LERRRHRQTIVPFDDPEFRRCGSTECSQAPDQYRPERGSEPYTGPRIRGCLPRSFGRGPRSVGALALPKDRHRLEGNRDQRSEILGFRSVFQT
jgi:hypothetical protein